MSPSELTILCWHEPDERDLHLANLAGFLGLAVRFLTVDRESATPRYLETAFPSAPVCLATTSTTLARLFTAGVVDQGLKSLLWRVTKHLLIFACDSDPASVAALAALTDGPNSPVTPVVDPSARYDISPEYRPISKQLTGLSVGPVNPETDLTSAPSGSMSEGQQIITIGNRHFFTAFRREECSIFLVGCKTVADLNAQVPPTVAVRSYFSQLIPVLMVLKLAFKDAVWHSTGSYANFMIDDPLIRKQYGFLNYRRLLDAMDTAGFATSIAFIPWNCRRTDPATAELFRSRPDKLSIVIHGCDHTAREFGVQEEAYVTQKINLAIDRMEYHRRVTGLPFARVMIFPQGVFSTAAMKALSATNCLAAVNSTALPASNPDITVSLRDLLEVAVLNYEGFPLFVRRYPRYLSDCALDLFLGKPLLLVEHHGYFRRGYDEIASFVSGINALDEDISWHGLGYVLEHATLVKKAAGHGICLKTPRGNTYVAGELEPLSAPAAQTVELGSCFHYSRGERLRVFTRRHLSEIRDNYLAKSESLLALSRGLNDFLALMHGHRSHPNPTGPIRH
jgi:hypothetical protein